MPSAVTSITAAWSLVASAVTGVKINVDLDAESVLLAVGNSLPANDSTAFSFAPDGGGEFMTLDGLALQNVYARTLNTSDKLRVIPMASNFVSPQPTSSANSGINPVKTAVAANSLIGKATAGNLYGFNVKAITGATAQQLLVFDSATVPADGTVAPVLAYDLPAAGTLSQSFNPPIRFNAGISFALSSTGPFTKTAAVAANFAMISAMLA